MENYTKGEVKEHDDLPCLPFHESVVHMEVNYGSKIKNILGYATKKIKNEVRQIAWNASGKVISKAISCAEIMKKRHKGLHQITDIRFKRVEEYWEPKLEGLERLKVNRDIPAATILLSKDPLDKSIPGYQAPGSFTAFWNANLPKEDDTKGFQKNKFRASANTPQPMARSKKRKQKKEKSVSSVPAVQPQNASLSDLMDKIDAISETATTMQTS